MLHIKIIPRLQVSHGRVQEEVDLANHSVAGLHFWQCRNRCLKRFYDRNGLPLETDTNEHIEAAPDHFWIDQGYVAHHQP